MAQAIGELVGQIVGAAIGALIGAFIVQFACKMVVKFKPPYGMAYKAVFLGYVAGVFLGFVLGALLMTSEQNITGTSTVLIMVTGFFAQAAIYGRLVKHPETGAIGFGNACLVSLLQLIFAALLSGAIVLLIFVAEAT